mmetsp:Transcript_28482/g.66815  ORF Transcript_28482/g.66815 Transcript_28482/m.66815 type:complete len:242 (+) Transcript_28482:428-1153(+)
MLQQLLCDGLQLQAFLEPWPHKVANVLVGHDIPNAVTCQNDELIFHRQVANHHVRGGAYHLLLRRQVGSLLVLQIANGTAEIQISVHAGNTLTVLHGAACGLDPTLFGLRCRLVVVRKLQCFPCPAHHCAAVPGICCDDILLANHDAHGRAAHCIWNKFITLLRLLEFLQLDEGLLHLTVLSVQQFSCLRALVHVRDLLLQFLDGARRNFAHKACQHLRIGWLAQLIVHSVKRGLEDLLQI